MALSVHSQHEMNQKWINSRAQWNGMDWQSCATPGPMRSRARAHTHSHRTKHSECKNGPLQLDNDLKRRLCYYAMSSAGTKLVCSNLKWRMNCGQSGIGAQFSNNGVASSTPARSLFSLSLWGRARWTTLFFWHSQCPMLNAVSISIFGAECECTKTVAGKCMRAPYICYHGWSCQLYCKMLQLFSIPSRTMFPIFPEKI